MRHSGAWRTLSALAVAVAVAGCGPVTPSPSASADPSAASPSPEPTPVADGSAWVPAGSLLEGRASTHAVALSDGRVLVVGSDNICTPGWAWDESAAAEVLDPVAGTWSETESLNAPRDGFVAVTLLDGRVLVTGGGTSDDPAVGARGAYSSTKLYDPQAGNWTPTALLNVARYAPASALLPDGTVLVAGGTYIDNSTRNDLASAEVYDPESREWSRTGDLASARGGAQFPVPDGGAQAVTLADGRVLIVGGSGPDTGGQPTVTTEIYDPAVGTWTAAGSLALPRQGFGLVALPDGGALVVGGVSGGASGGPVAAATASAERFDPRTLSWFSAGSMHRAAVNRSAALLGDGRVLVAGGMTGPDQQRDSVAIADAELYDPSTGSWTATTPLPEPRERSSAVTLADRSVLLVGGDRGYAVEGGGVATPWCPEPVAAAVRYVPANLTSFPEPTPRPAPVALAISDVPRASASPAAAKEAAASINAFGVDLYKRMLADGTLGPTKGAVISPTSIVLALAMARAGARDETAAQMDAVLHTAGWDKLGTGLNALDQALASREATWQEYDGTVHELALRIANAAFVQPDWSIAQSYLDAIAATLGAGLRLVDYQADPEAARKVINAWVSKKTAKRIPKLIPDPPPALIRTDTRLVLVNAIYLKANWALEFSKDATKPATFTRLDGSRVQVPTMTQQATVPYATGRGWRATELLYLARDHEAPLAMALILPDDLASFEERLTANRLQGIVGELETARDHLYDEVACTGTDMICCHHPYDVDLFLPRFGIEANANLGSALVALGMRDAFEDTRADFSGITDSDRLVIEEVVHQANIDVDEKGTVAAAATAVILATTGGCGPSDPFTVITLRLDRPFFFVLRDVETGAILFMGRVTDPSVR